MKHRALRGTRDILPEEAARWQRVEATARRTFAAYGFREIRTPIIEATELFARSVGASSDIVSKQMYSFTVGDEAVALRPENTAPVVRAFIEHALHRNVAEGYPERYFYIGPMFRHERPQKGRQRQFHQLGVELLGADEPLADAETIQMVVGLLAALGLADSELLLNSVGDPVCRTVYRERLRDWLVPRLGQLCEDCQRRFTDNPLRVFDCKVEADRRLVAEAPSVLDSLCQPCADHFAAVQGALDAYGVVYRVEPRLVRGLDYYVRTVFEVLHGGLGAQNAILGGGRYDGLVAELGGPPISGFGFAAGLERLVLLLGPEAATEDVAALALVAVGSAGFSAAIALAQRLRAAGVPTLMPIVERPLGAQLRRADKHGARYALFVGGEELASGMFGLKDLRSGEQTLVDEAGLLAHWGRAHGD